MLSLPAYYRLRRFTRASVFSLVLAVMAALLCLVTLLRMGLLQWLENDPGKVYFHLLPFALLFFVAALCIEHLRYQADSRYFYPIAVVFTLGVEQVVLTASTPDLQQFVLKIAGGPKAYGDPEKFHRRK